MFAGHTCPKVHFLILQLIFVSTQMHLRGTSNDYSKRYVFVEKYDKTCQITQQNHIYIYISGPSCSKLTMPLVNVLLKL